MPAPTWGIVTTALEIDEILLAFVAHHQDAGANEVFIYLEGRAPHFERIAAQLDQVKVFHSDQAAWGRLHTCPRPEHIATRQRINADHARAITRCDWLFHIDSDEFLVNDPELGAFLAELPDDIWAVHLPVAERIFETADDSPHILSGGVFRTPFEKREGIETLKSIYRRNHKFLKLGMAGHSQGKSGVRVTSPARLKIHDIALPDGEDPALHLVRYPGVGHVHFDAWSFEVWLRKQQTIRQRPTNRKARQLLADAVFDAKTEANKRGLYRSIYVLDPKAIELLDGQGHIFRMDFDVNGSIQKVFPGVKVNLKRTHIEKRKRGRITWEERLKATRRKIETDFRRRK